MTGALRGDDQVDVLGPERRAGLDLRLDVARQETEFVRIDFQLQLRKIRAGRISVGLHLRHFTDLDAAQLDLRVVFHDQTGPVGNDGERNGCLQRSFERHRGQRADRDDHQNEYRCPPNRVNPPAPPGLLAHSHPPDRWKLPDCPYTDSVIVSRINTPAVIDERTARPTASPTPAGPPVAL